MAPRQVPTAGGIRKPKLVKSEIGLLRGELPTPTRLGYGVGFHPHGRLPQQPWIFYVQSVLVLHPLRWQ